MNRIIARWMIRILGIFIANCQQTVRRIGCMKIINGAGNGITIGRNEKQAEIRPGKGDNNADGKGTVSCRLEKYCDGEEGKRWLGVRGMR